MKKSFNMIFLFFRNTGSCSGSISSEGLLHLLLERPGELAGPAAPFFPLRYRGIRIGLCKSQNPSESPLIHVQLLFDLFQRHLCLPELNGSPFFFSGKLFTAWWHFLLLPWYRMYWIQWIAISGCGQLNTRQTGSFCPRLMKFCLLQPETYTETEKKTAGRWDRHGRYNINKYTGQIFPRIL